MALHPTDFNSEIMRAEHGTVVLATSPIADKYLKKAQDNQCKAAEGRKRDPVGVYGFTDDFVEWWTL